MQTISLKLYSIPVSSLFLRFFYVFKRALNQCKIHMNYPCVCQQNCTFIFRNDNSVSSVESSTNIIDEFVCDNYYKKHQQICRGQFVGLWVVRKFTENSSTKMTWLFVLTLYVTLFSACTII